MNWDDRFWTKVDKADGDGCWTWTAGLDKDGYGRFRLDGRHQRAHRISYELLVGEIPGGLQLDHLCRARSCVKPAHLEPVTGAVNVQRGLAGDRHQAAKTVCPQGHPYDTENTYRDPDGKRRCRTCRTAGMRRYKAARGAAA